MYVLVYHMYRFIYLCMYVYVYVGTCIYGSVGRNEYQRRAQLFLQPNSELCLEQHLTHLTERTLNKLEYH
jgi:Tfp pilus assembly protein PilN